MSNNTWKEQIEDLCRASAPLIVLETVEEERVATFLQELARALGRHFSSCDLAEGLEGAARPTVASGNARDPLSLLDQIERQTGQGIFHFKDAHEAWSNAQVKRKLRSVAQRCAYAGKTIIVTCPVVQLPAELRDVAVVLQVPLPTAKEIEEVLDDLLRHPNVRATLTPADRERLIQAATGLTLTQARRSFARAIIQDGDVDARAIPIVIEEKRRIIAESNSLEFYDTTGFRDAVGGLGALKQWLQTRAGAFTREAAEFGLPSPKGIGLIGIPGTGKSLAAKMTANLYGMPLVRLDMGNMFGSLVGESESSMRRALGLAEAISPCVLWIDEVEKGMAHGGLDGGTSERVTGTLLIWMAEKTTPCFVFVTANDVTKLPPEFLRKGRFDEIFFLDLPNLTERREIFAVHLRKRSRDPRKFNLDLMASSSEGHVGSEIEQAVVDALFQAYNDKRRELTTEDILDALQLQVPLAVSQREKIDELRLWQQEGRARSASLPDSPTRGNEPPSDPPPLEFRPKSPRRPH